MNDNLKDILSHLNPDVDQETLMKYLEGRLSAGEQHQLEREIMDDDFELDALEGLEAFEDRSKINNIIAQLDADLKKRTQKKNRLKKPLAKLEPWLLITLVTVLLLVVIAYFIIHRLYQQ